MPHASLKVTPVRLTFSAQGAYVPFIQLSQSFQTVQQMQVFVCIREFLAKTLFMAVTLPAGTSMRCL